MKRKFNLLCTLILCAITTISSVLPVYSLDQIDANHTAVYVDEKIHCKATLEDNFAGNRV